MFLIYLVVQSSRGSSTSNGSYSTFVTTPPKKNVSDFESKFSLKKQSQGMKYASYSSSIESVRTPSKLSSTKSNVGHELLSTRQKKMIDIIVSDDESTTNQVSFLPFTSKEFKLKLKLFYVNESVHPDIDVLEKRICDHVECRGYLQCRELISTFTKGNKSKWMMELLDARHKGRIHDEEIYETKRELFMMGNCLHPDVGIFADCVHFQCQHLLQCLHPEEDFYSYGPEEPDQNNQQKDDKKDKIVAVKVEQVEGQQVLPQKRKNSKSDVIVKGKKNVLKRKVKK